MTPEIARRSASLLFVALALAAGFGLMSLPAFDWLGPISRLPGVLGWMGFGLHTGLAWLCTSLVLRQLAQHVHPDWEATPTRWMVVALIGLALIWWLQSALRTGSADGRGLLWLETLALWLWPAGLLSAAPHPARANRGRLDGMEPAEYRWHDTGSMKEVEVGSGGHMALGRPRQHRAPGRKHNVVRLAEDTEEALPA
jgi:hypothetical protein